MKKIAICLVVILLVTVSVLGRHISPSREDGFDDDFERNIAHYYDPNIPNDVYVISYARFDKSLDDLLTKSTYQFFTSLGKVPLENIIALKGKESNADNLKDAINQIAKKSDKNDIVFLSFNSAEENDIDDNSGEINYGIREGVRYTELNEWLNEIEAKVIIVKIQAAHADKALTILKDGNCPRIIFVYSAGEFFSALGLRLDEFHTVDTEYGNGNGYVSLGEIGYWLDCDPKWGPDWGKLHEEGRSFVNAYGYSKMSDTSEIAYRIYLSDFYYKPAIPEES